MLFLSVDGYLPLAIDTLTLKNIGRSINTLSFQNDTPFIPVNIIFFSCNFNLTRMQINEKVLNPDKHRTTWLNGNLLMIAY